MDFTIALDNHSTLPLHRQLYEELRRLILAGKLPPGKRIPSTRGMAKSLGISRSTVTQSYEQLLSEGYLQTVTGSGTFVCSQFPDDLLSTLFTDNKAGILTESVQLSSYGDNLLKTDYFVTLNNSKLSTQLINFQYGNPTLDDITLKQWRKLLSRYCRVNNQVMLNYADDSRGYLPLREAISRYLVQSRAVQCEADQVIIVSGSQQALELITRILIEPGDEVAIENPSYLDAQQIFWSNGAKLLPIDVDKSGIIVDKLSDYANAKIKLIYVTPSHQFPTGAVMSLSRRLELLAWTTSSKAMIIEDDYDSEFRYIGRPIPALQGLDPGKVIYIGTFSKVLFPALRIGYLVVPKSLVAVVAYAKRLTDRHSPMLEQQVLTDFIKEGYLERQIRRMRKLYDRQRQVLIQALWENLGDRVTILGENSGMHLMVRFKTNLSNHAIVEQAAKKGVKLVTAQRYYLLDNGSSEFVFGYTNLTVEEINEGVSRLAQILAIN